MQLKLYFYFLHFAYPFFLVFPNVKMSCILKQQQNPIKLFLKDEGYLAHKELDNTGMKKMQF